MSRSSTLRLVIVEGLRVLEGRYGHAGGRSVSGDDLGPAEHRG
jgi:hypothetical protein